ncbi:MAG: nucleotide exchange factor GrpE [Defluviitaleaceae bacterium]|nr:nucleotide exchange factor GrpE [Defluviitaleaceae bacterium]MCL2836485.1 nucleotide exchange factor GrpE [Defluviitaleaceae bacterium]
MTEEEIFEQEQEEAQKTKKKKNKKADELDTLKQQAAESTDKYLRVMAEFDNFRKRTVREKSAQFDTGVQTAVLKFLPVIDNFERAMAAAPPDDSMCKGFAMILRQMKDILASLGVSEINAIGQPFDPTLHEAVMLVESEGREPGTVAEELIKGYIYKDKPIRHSMVKVVN